ncbi:unnamed protein product [Rodentolepis nana]|uniref:Uncharacterized protein n=1 Tax=Rodentolepis nana TaxID=102285 RepID=A0A0R3TZG8_RODNA|nr:unnamed protein product [Rodentolepis nana]
MVFGFFTNFSNIIILENDLLACRGQLASERGLATQRERQLMQRIQELTSRLWVAEKFLESARTGSIVRCVSERRIHDLSCNSTATIRRRTKSSEPILTSVSNSFVSAESVKKKKKKKLSDHLHQPRSSVKISFDALSSLRKKAFAEMKLTSLPLITSLHLFGSSKMAEFIDSDVK